MAATAAAAAAATAAAAAACAVPSGNGIPRAAPGPHGACAGGRSGQGGGDEAARRHLAYGLRPAGATPQRRRDVTLAAASRPSCPAFSQQMHPAIRQRFGGSLAIWWAWFFPPSPRVARGNSPVAPAPVWPPAQGEPGWDVTQRPLVAEETPVRRLRAQDKSGAGESGPVSMEEQETEEVGGRSSRKKNCIHRQRRLPPPCIGVSVSGVGRGRGDLGSQSLLEEFCRARRDWLAMTSCCSSGWGQSRRGRLLQRQREK
ncbi:uncharacterized protein LOC103732233 [Nannospalax galili]|uniref:uncharacterized protein LOC103732233 n=1 Tax=Nannospalax galili TaxID=1026970 RepID=UPI000819E387|nr:uncharacterized protein LOC103732233 [Nannospalax galili]